jgi:hypothetical protein
MMVLVLFGVAAGTLRNNRIGWPSMQRPSWDIAVIAGDHEDRPYVAMPTMLHSA